MSTHNILTTIITCPRCDQTTEMKVETFFGLGNLFNYQLGDQVIWRNGRNVKNGGRPLEGNMDGTGYTTCPECNLDFFVKVLVRGDILKGALPDSGKEPFIPSDKN